MHREGRSPRGGRHLGARGLDRIECMCQSGRQARASASAAVGMVVCGRLSDTARERRWHIVIPGVLGVAGLLVGSLLVLTMP